MIAAPASAASIEARAISSGVSGRWGVIVGVWIEPVTAQVMMTLRAAAMNPPRAGVSMSPDRATADRHHRRSARWHNLKGYRAAAAAMPQDLGTLMLAALRQGARDWRRRIRRGCQFCARRDR